MAHHFLPIKPGEIATCSQCGETRDALSDPARLVDGVPPRCLFAPLASARAELAPGIGNTTLLPYIPSNSEFMGNSCNSDNEKEIILFQKLSDPAVEYATDLKPQRLFLTADTFIEWFCRGFFMYAVDKEDKQVCVSKFDQIVAGNVYFLKNLGDDFFGFADAEATVQTEDAMKCIQDGIIDDDKLKHFAGLKPEFEYQIDVPAASKLKKGVSGPIVPDGVIFNETDVLVMESKHQVTSKRASLFLKKCDILQENSDALWFVKKHPVKKYNIVPVMCSVDPLPSDLLKKYSGKMTFLIRRGLKYVKL